ncbi:transcription factor MYB4 [Brachypodium distachyon]|uniref:Uncharacterized protein n=1 Tax=Brachypodium distachyon TaxID=15368 RepID=I1HQG5_BRADI|nr:transcription factor MYB4 [Brachypodium distachyon]KQK09222.1 hypothetical protein BRADI_2g46770v3 [Brachypodium distachyon]|eukprot:XP_003567000.1 transcription factor MYB4 [Brachypodium distachyon]
MGRAPCCDKASVKRGPWAPEEDELLRSYVRSHGAVGNWIALPHKAGLNRCGKSCRLRWLNYLRPDIKHGGYTEQEDMVICSLYNSIGSRWSIIASKLPGRTDNDVKNYWNTKLKKKAMGMGIHQQQQHYHHQGAVGRRGASASAIATPPPPPAPQSQCAPSSMMHPSPASASSAVTTASAGDVACSFMYSDAPAPPALPHYHNAEFSPPVQPTTQAAAANGSWASGMMAFDDMFLPELIGGGGDQFPLQGDLFAGYLGPLLQDNYRLPSSSSSAQLQLQELSACYFPNAQAEMWAAADHAKPPPAGLCPSLT